MRTRRPISINNSLAQGVCNYSCRLCAVGKPGYRGPKAFQSREVTARLIERIEEAAKDDVQVRYVANAGDGEPTLHPDFRERAGMFGQMLRRWNGPVPAPEVSVVTNGTRLARNGVLDAIADNGLTLIVSLPTAVPEHYGAVMVGRPAAGRRLLGMVTPGIERALALRASGRLGKLCFHISPPEREIVRGDFPRTIEFLAEKARAAGAGEIELVMFPATSNRTGLVAGWSGGVDFYRDLFERYDGREIGGVRVGMQLVLKRFFAGAGEIADLVRSFRFPCIWNANLFVAAGGESICCNDQAVSWPQGNVLDSSISELLERKERMAPTGGCAACDQRPELMRGTPAARVFALAARGRMALAGVRAAGRRRKESLASGLSRRAGEQ